MNGLEIKKIASRLIKKHRTNDPFEIARCLDYITVFCPLKLSTKGFYQFVQRSNVIYINDSLNEHEQRMVCAHELGHGILHKKTNTVFLDSRTFFNKSKYEIEANTFGAELLIQNNFKDYEGWTCAAIAQDLCVSPEFVQIKFSNM